MKKRVEINEGSEEPLPAISKPVNKSAPKEKDMLPAIEKPAPIKKTASPIKKPVTKKKTKEEIREEEIGIKRKEDIPMDIREIYEEHVEESLEKRKYQRIRKNLFYTLIIFGFLGLIVAPMLSTYFEFAVNPEAGVVKAAWETMPLGERIDFSIKSSLKHWYFYFIPIAFFVSTVFFTRKDGD